MQKLKLQTFVARALHNQIFRSPDYVQVKERGFNT